MGRKFKTNNFAQKRRERKQSKGVNVVQRPYQEIVKENEKFIRFYKHAKICVENEWENFVEAMRKDLPTTFRISGCRNTAKKLLNVIRDEFFEKYIADQETKPKPLPWYPNEFAWQLELTRKDIRRLESCYKLHNFLIAETTTGNISRQEAVSMIPPIVLDVKPHHKVLDTCASPGSKTAQLIEALHADESDSIPSGLVVANDIDNSRCYMLVHQAKRLNSPCFIVTNQDSSCMPKFRNTDLSEMKFDRILCDVPCSGDGTMRKNPDIWKKWHLGNALNLHGIQYRILRRGCELLDVGGRLVYSTCSLNPIENEAVLHRLLKDSGGALELVDVSNLVPGLIYKPGISHWELADKDCTTFYGSFEEVPEEYHTVIRPQMFPPSKEDSSLFSLNKCMRILPHFQNTGGFFVAALTKIRLLPWEKKSKEKNDNGKDEEKQCPERKKRRIFGYKEDPYVFFPEEEPVWKELKSFFNIDDKDTNSFKSTQLLTRSLTGKKKNIYYCSEAVKNLVQANEQNIKIINTGVKVFSRCEHRNMRCEFRLANEGLHSINKMIGESRRIAVTKNDLILLLQHTNPQNQPKFESLSEITRERMKVMESGSCILQLEEEYNSLKLLAVGWKGMRSLRAYIDLNDAVHMLRLLGTDVSQFEVNKFQKKSDDTEKKV